MDPNQAMIFMFMPLLMGVISIKMPAGVLIYWASQQVFSNIQQYLMMRNSKDPDDAITVTVRTAKKTD
jgi:membrane protein insertase Oxa1/YidC/SpoIIIJ